MSGKLPQLQARQIIRALRKDGWELERTRGSHHHFYHDTKPGMVTVPVHKSKDIGLGIMRSILRQAGLTEDEFRELL